MTLPRGIKRYFYNLGSIEQPEAVLDTAADYHFTAAFLVHAFYIICGVYILLEYVLLYVRQVYLTAVRMAGQNKVERVFGHRIEVVRAVKQQYVEPFRVTVFSQSSSSSFFMTSRRITSSE